MRGWGNPTKTPIGFDYLRRACRLSISVRLAVEIWVDAANCRHIHKVIDPWWPSAHNQESLSKMQDWMPQMLRTRVTDCCVSQDVWKEIFGTFPWIFRFHNINETFKQYSLSDTLFNYIFTLDMTLDFQEIYINKSRKPITARLAKCSRFWV